jgi:hypothetical protein
MKTSLGKVKKLTEAQAAYLAGIVDGEGTITLTRRNTYRQRYLTLTISNCEVRLLEYVLKLIGVGRITTKRTYNDNHSTAYTYQISSKQALDVIGAITPFLKTYKRKRAVLALSCYTKLTPRNGKYTDATLKKREYFIQKFFSILPGNVKTRPNERVFT